MTLAARDLRRAASRTGRPEYKWLVLGVVSLGSFMTTMDASTVAVSLPELQVAFGISPSTALWVVTSYLLTSMALLLIVGRRSDARGRQAWSTAGVLGFTPAVPLAPPTHSTRPIVPFPARPPVGAAVLPDAVGFVVAVACVCE